VGTRYTEGRRVSLLRIVRQLLTQCDPSYVQISIRLRTVKPVEMYAHQCIPKAGRTMQKHMHVSS
jgi:hypothetical protein